MKIIHLAQNANDVDLQGTNLTVYHRTKNQDIAGSICTIGFIAGGGDAYGKGVYSTYTLKSSLQNYNLKSYGGEILKASVNVDGFLILDYAISKQVYGSNYRLIDQIKNVIGEDKIFNRSLDKKSQWADIENMSRELSGGGYRTAGIASRLSSKYRLDRSGVNGIIFTGLSDGRICVIYKEMLVTPISHAWIDGKTYKNPQWTDCGSRSQEELIKLQQDERKSELFRKDRVTLLDTLSRYSDKGTINLDPSNFPNVPEGIFDEAMATFLYEDDSRIQRLSPYLRTKLKDIIEVEILIKKLKSAPTVHWNEFKQLDQEIQNRIPKEVQIDIWEKFIVVNPGYWDQIPEDIRTAIPKEAEAKHWAGLVKKNENNWKYVHPEIAEYMKDTFGIAPPQGMNLEDKDTERISETEEIDIPVSALGWIQDNIAKMNKRAGRLGLRPITHEVIGEDPKTRTQKVKIVGNVPFLKGWKLIARVSRVVDETNKEYNAVETLSDEGIPDGMDLDNAEMDCNHCGHNRKRKECYVVKNEDAEDPKYNKGQYLMIGSTCLGDFIGDIGGTTSPEGIAKYAQMFRQMLVLFKEGSEFQNKSDDDIRKTFKNKGVPIAFFLSKVMQLDKKHGFVGRKESYNTGKAATAQLAWDMCIDLPTDQKYSTGVDASDLATIYSALAWIQTIPDPDEGEKDFLYNIKKSCELGTVFGKKKNGNIGVVAWLPTAYKRNVEEKKDYSKIVGEGGEEIRFAGTVTGKRPVLVQISQQVKQGQNNTKNYMMAEGEGRTVAFFEEAPIQANMGQPIFVKGKVESNAFVSGVSATTLKDVTEISEEEYLRYKPYMDQKLAELAKKQKPDAPAAAPLSGSPQGKYQDGSSIVEDFTIMQVKPAKGGQELFFLEDGYKQRVSVFTNIQLGAEGDRVRLSGTVQINGRYINLVNVQIVAGDSVQPDVKPTAPQAQPTVAVNYQDGATIEEDFTISDIKQANYGSMLYNLLDTYGKKVSAFIKGSIGVVGDIVRLSAIVKLKGQYINLTRVKVIPKSTKAPTAPPQPASQPITHPTATLPAQPSGTQPPPPATDGKDGISANSHNWYRISKLTNSVPDFLEPKQQEPDSLEDITDMTAPDAVDSDPTPEAPLYRSPDEVDLDKAYDMFSDSYQKATGKAWDKGKFLNRSGDWLFYGDDNGYIAVRPQRPGLYKLVGIAGDDSNPIAKGMALLKGFKNLMSEGKPTWGMVSQDLKGMAERMGMKSPSPMAIKSLIKFIPKGVFGGAKINQIMPDGAVEFEYADVGLASKYFIANSEYYKWLGQSVDSNDRVPEPAKFVIKKMLDQIAKSRAFVKTATVESFDRVEGYIDISETWIEKDISVKI